MKFFTSRVETNQSKPNNTQLFEFEFEFGHFFTIQIIFCGQREWKIDEEMHAQRPQLIVWTASNDSIRYWHCHHSIGKKSRILETLNSLISRNDSLAKLWILLYKVSGVDQERSASDCYIFSLVILVAWIWSHSTKSLPSLWLVAIDLHGIFANIKLLTCLHALICSLL